MLGQITDAPISEVEKAEKGIREQKEEVKEYETEANKQEAKLKQGCLYNNCTCVISNLIAR